MIRSLLQKRWFRRGLWTLLVLLVLVLLVIPLGLMAVVNGTLNAGAGREGSVGWVWFNPFSWTATAVGVDMRRFDTEREDDPSTERDERLVSTIRADAIAADLAFWRLFTGRVAGRVDIHRPVIELIAPAQPSPEDRTDVAGLDIVLPDAVPFTIEEVRLTDATFRYVSRAEQDSGAYDLQLDDARLVIRGLTNTVDAAAGEMPGAIILEGSGPAGGVTSAEGRFRIAGDHTRLEIELISDGMHLPRLNDLFVATAGLEMASGTAQLKADYTFQDRSYDGTVTLWTHNMDIYRWGAGTDEGMLQQLFKSIAGQIGQVLANSAGNEGGVRVPMSGDYQQQEIGFVPVVVSALRNGFFMALIPGFGGGGGEPQAEVAGVGDEAAPGEVERTAAAPAQADKQSEDAEGNDWARLQPPSEGPLAGEQPEREPDAAAPPGEDADPWQRLGPPGESPPADEPGEKGQERPGQEDGSQDQEAEQQEWQAGDPDDVGAWERLDPPDQEL